MKNLNKFIAMLAAISLLVACQENNGEKKIRYSENYKADSVSNDLTKSVADEQTELDNKAAEEPAVNEKAKTEDKENNTYYLKDSDGSGAVTNASLSSSAAKENNDPTKKFVRTADLKFRVKDVLKSSLSIEDLAAKYDGYVAYTNLENQELSSTTESYKDDSLIEVHKSRMQNNIVLRIPNTKLDSLLREIGGLVDHFDYRKIEASDVSLQYLMNERTIKNSRRKAGRLEGDIDRRGYRLYDITDAEDYASAAGINADGKEIENLGLLNDVQYSKVVINLYQLPVVSSTVVVSDRVYDKFKPSFGYRLQKALLNSWYGLLEVLLFFANIWYLVVLAAVAIGVARKYGKTKFKQIPTA